MKMTNKKSTRKNTIFVTPTTYQPSQMEMLISSARKNDIFLDVVEEPKWKSHYYNNVFKVAHHLQNRLDNGYEYGFVMDARDVAIIGHVDTICDRLNEIIEQGTVLFNADFNGSMFPYGAKWYRDLYFRMNGSHRILNAGLYAGRIVDLLQIMKMAELVRNEFLSNNFVHYICKLIFETQKKRYADDDQFLYQLTSIIQPRLFKIDSEKQLLACVDVTEKNYDLENRVNNYHKGKYSIGDALIIHMPGTCINPSFISRHRLNEPVPKFNYEKSNSRLCRCGVTTDRLSFEGHRPNRGYEVKCFCEELCSSEMSYYPIYESYCHSGLCRHYKSF
jgi:hypothetical protein